MAKKQAANNASLAEEAKKKKQKNNKKKENLPLPDDIDESELFRIKYGFLDEDEKVEDLSFTYEYSKLDIEDINLSEVGGDGGSQYSL